MRVAEGRKKEASKGMLVRVAEGRKKEASKGMLVRVAEGRKKEASSIDIHILMCERLYTYILKFYPCL